MKNEKIITLESGRHISEGHIVELAKIEMDAGCHMDSIEDYDNELEFFLSSVDNEKGQYADCYIIEQWSKELTGSEDDKLTEEEAIEIAGLVHDKIIELYEKMNDK